MVQIRDNFNFSVKLIFDKSASYIVDNSHIYCAILHYLLQDSFLVNDNKFKLNFTSWTVFLFVSYPTGISSTKPLNNYLH